MAVTEISAEIYRNPLSWVDDFEVSMEEAERFENPEWLYENLIIRGHVIAIPAPPNGGKTTILLHIAGELVEHELSVYYVCADVGQSDAKEMVAQADQASFKLLLPDLKAGCSMDDVVYSLEEMNENGGDFSRVVFIFDTLKKCVDVINKTRAKELYALFRSLSAKGMTIVLLAHTNKYNDSDGRPIFEGTVDLRADVDELIYFIPKKNDDGSMTISTEPDKVRGKFRPITFDISPDREVTQREYVDVIAMEKADKQREQDSPIIELITAAIQREQFTEASIRRHIKDSGTGIGWRSLQGVLNRYIGELWTCERTKQNNAKQYFLI